MKPQKRRRVSPFKLDETNVLHQDLSAIPFQSTVEPPEPEEPEDVPWEWAIFLENPR